MTPKDYIDRGYYLIPIKPGTKEPLYDPPHFTKGAADATQDLKLLEKYEHFGLVCNNCTVLDFDLYKGIDAGMQQLLQQCLVTDRERHNVTVQKTPSGGLHIIYAKNEGLRLNIPNLDIRNSNQYICVDPTPGYAWFTHCRDGIVNQNFPPVNMLTTFMSNALVNNEVRRTGYDVPTIKPTPSQWEGIMRWLQGQKPAISGNGGHNQTYRVASDLRVGFNLDTETVHWLLLNVYNEKCQPMWTENELWHKANSIVVWTKPGYLLATLEARQEIQLPYRIERAGKYLYECTDPKHLRRVITKMRIGFDLPAVAVLKLLEVYKPNLLLTTELKDYVYNPDNLHNLPVGYMLREKERQQ